MKKMNKKGFTIVELVIVIAVIAILAAVMIPTFSGVVDKANESNALQTAKNAYTALLIAEDDASINDKSTTDVDAYIKVGSYVFSVTDGVLAKATAVPATGYPEVTDYSIYPDIDTNKVDVYFPTVNP